MANADKNLSLNVVVTSNTEPLTNTTNALNGVGAAASSVSTPVQRLAQGSRDLEEAHKKVATGTAAATKTTSNFGQAAMQAAFFADDLQYGLNGVVNNIPILLSTMGLGAGLAGVLSLVAVGLNVAVEKFGLFGGKAEVSADKLAELTREATKAAAAAHKDAEATDAAEASLAEHVQQIAAAESAYNGLTEAMSRTQKRREEMNRAIVAETDGELALKLTEIEQKKEEGAITEIEALKMSTDARRQAAADKFNLEQAERTRAIGENGQRARGANSAAAGIEDATARQADAMNGLLDPENRKAAQEDLKVREAELAEALKKLNATSDYQITYKRGPGGDYAATERNPDYDPAVDAAARAQSAASAARDKVDGDEAAQARTGSTDADALRKELETERKKASQLRKEAEALEEKNRQLAEQRASTERLYSLSTRQMDASTRLQQTRMLNQSVDPEEQERRRLLLQSPDWQGPTQGPDGTTTGPRRAGGFGPRSAISGSEADRRAAMAGLDSMPSSPIPSRDNAAARTAADSLGKSAAAHTDANADLLKSLVESFKTQKGMLDRQTKEIKDLHSQIKEARYGR